MKNYTTKKSILPLFLCFLLTLTTACAGGASDEDKEKKLAEAERKNKEKKLDDKEEKLYEELEVIFNEILAKDSDNDNAKKIKKAKVAASMAILRDGMRSLEKSIEDDKIASIKELVKLVEGFTTVAQPIFAAFLFTGQIMESMDDEEKLKKVKEDPATEKEKIKENLEGNEKMLEKLPEVFHKLTGLVNIVNERAKLKKERKDKAKDEDKSKQKAKKSAKLITTVAS